MSTPGWRRWVLPVYAVLLALCALALVVSFAAFGGPSSAVAWLGYGVTSVSLIVLIFGELKARGEGS
jgi:hypothetical protein